MTKVDELTVSVNVGLSVSDETAQACLKLIELWLNDNPDKCIEGGLRGADGKVEPLLIKRHHGEEETKAKIGTEEATRAVEGRWICSGSWSEGIGMGETYGCWWKCSKCGKVVKGDHDRCGYAYCPNCGKKLEREEDDNG